jgi:glutamate-1-semialdehyde 2,1-aminomutase
VEYIEGLNTKRSAEYFKQARKILPGGAGSNARCYPAYDPYPIVIDHGSKSHIWDVDGNEYIDLLCSYGALIHGHCNPKIMEAVREQLGKGTMFGTATELELEVAKRIHSFVPTAEMMRFGSSGAEAVMAAIRIARGYTGKDKIIKFEGGFHGAFDYVLLSGLGYPTMGSRISPHPVPTSWGIPDEIPKTMIVLPWNDLEILEKTVKRRASEIAGILTEPMQMNYGAVLPEEGYLKGIQELCNENDIAFILDEVITGFRLAPGGAQEYYDIEVDISTYSKALGGGYPISAVAGKREIFDYVAPGKIYQAGTYNANPLCLAAANATLKELAADDYAAFKHLTKAGNALIEGLREAVDKSGAQAIVQGIGGAGCQLYMTKEKKIKEYRDSFSCDPGKYREFHRHLLAKGVFLHPSQTEHIFVSSVHTDDDIGKVQKAAEFALKRAK